MRDDRGYEYTSLLHPVRRHGRTETQLLYCYRTPPYIKVGRPALDEDARALLEQQYPDITFDWDRILREPPQALPEHEAARRKEQRDARDARRKRRRPVEIVEDQAPVEMAEASAVSPPDEPAGGDLENGEDVEADPEDEGDVLTNVQAGEAAAPSADAPASGAARRRRRRRRRKRQGGEPGGNPPPGSPPNGSV
ncbi:MAG: hypothetical protein ACM36C_16255 [Acidobacteriota bacterium]